MSGRILGVTAHTTLDFASGRAIGHDWSENATAVCDVSTPRRNPDHVRLAFELDNTELESLPAHADELRLTPDQARTLAAALEREATTVEATLAEDDASDSANDSR